MTGRLLLTTEVAERLRKPEATLRYWRHKGVGPSSFRIGRTVVYPESELERWIDDQQRADLERQHAPADQEPAAPRESSAASS